MNGINKVILVGHCSDIKKYDKLIAFSMATNEVFKDSEGNKQTRTEWHNIKCFGKLGETLANLISKGAQLYIEGSIRSNDSADGKRYIDIVASVVQIIQFAKDNTKPEAKSEPTQSPKPGFKPEPQQQAQGAQLDNTDNDSDLPF